MELKDFVSQSLKQIFEGVNEAQSKTSEIGGKIASDIVSTRFEHSSILGYSRNQPVISIEFDVSVTTQDSSQEKGGIGIFIASLGLGGQIGSESLSKQLNRLRFSVPVILPVVEQKSE